MPPTLRGHWLASAGCLFSLLLGCASRSAVPRTPPTSPASLTAPEAHRARVTYALDGDPPLPGESVEAWPGLQPAAGAPAPDPHAGHHHHHQHGTSP